MVCTSDGKAFPEYVRATKPKGTGGNTESKVIFSRYHKTNHYIDDHLQARVNEQM